MSNETNNTTTTPVAVTPKKTRKAGHQWLRFWSLKQAEVFLIGAAVFQKDGCCSKRKADGIASFIWPWTRVHTLRPVKKGPPYRGVEFGKDQNPIRTQE